MTRLRLHFEASQERDKFAKQALALLGAGKEKQGRAAAAEAERWDRKAKELES